EVVESALARRLTGLPGLARAGWLVAFDYGDGSRGHALVIEGATARVEDALAAALSEALVFSGVDAGVLDITFPAEDAPLWPAIQRQGRRLAFPAAAVPQPPGSNPDAPPKLR
ncbi:MAG: SseB family protein, partial [Pseudomonadota bacterium]